MVTISILLLMLLSSLATPGSAAEYYSVLTPRGPDNGAVGIVRLSWPEKTSGSSDGDAMEPRPPPPVRLSVRVAGLPDMPLGNSMLVTDTGDSLPLAFWPLPAEPGLPVRAYYAAEGILAPSVATAAATSAAAGSVPRDIIVRTARGISLAGTLVAGTGPPPASTMAEGRAAGRIEVLLSCRSGTGGGVQCAGITGLASVALTTDDKNTLGGGGGDSGGDSGDSGQLDYTVVVAGKAAQQGAGARGGFYNVRTGALLHRMPSSSLTGTWSSVPSSVLDLVAAGQVMMRVMLGPGGSYPIVGRLNAEPLYVAGPRDPIIAETAPPGSVVFTNDPQRRFVYTKGPLSHVLTVESESFGVNTDSGAVMVAAPQGGAAPFNFNLRRRYELYLEVSNAHSGRTEEVKVVVALADANNNAPRFIQDRYYASVLEGRPAGSAVTTLRAEDADVSFPRLTYALIQDPLAPVPFRVTSIKREEGGAEVWEALLSSTAALDREVRGQYLVTISASDGLNAVAETTVFVTVADENDHRPKFSGPGVTCGTSNSGSADVGGGGGGISNVCTLDDDTLAVQEDAAVGVLVANVTVMDADVGLNARLSLAFPERFVAGCDGVAAKIFAIEPRRSLGDSTVTPGANGVVQAGSSVGVVPPLDLSGEGFIAARLVVRAGVRLDHERTPHVRVCLLARDTGVPSLTTLLRFNVTITDVPFRLEVSNLETGERIASNISYTAAPLIALTVYTNGEEPDATTAVNNAAAEARLEYRIDGDILPRDCALGVWADAGPCQTFTNLGFVNDCLAASAAPRTGLRLQRRAIVTERDPRGLGRDCPRYDGAAASQPTAEAEVEARANAQLASGRVGAVLNERYAVCLLAVCEAAGGGGDGLSVEWPPVPTRAALQRMNSRPLNGYLRNHPVYDNWEVDGDWRPRSLWPSSHNSNNGPLASLRQILTHSADSSELTELAVWRPCARRQVGGGSGSGSGTAGTGAGAGLSCNVNASASAGPHGLEVRLVFVVPGDKLTPETAATKTVVGAVHHVVVVDLDAPIVMVRDTALMACSVPGRTATCAATRPVRAGSTLLVPVVHRDTDSGLCGPACLLPAAPGKEPDCSLCQSGAPPVYMCRLDGARSFTACPMASSVLSSAAAAGLTATSCPNCVHIHLSGLTSGPHHLLVGVADAAGHNNYGVTKPPLSLTWQTVADAPRTVLTSWPLARVTRNRSAVFDFACSQPVCTFRCTLDGTLTTYTRTSVRTGSWRAAGLDDGTHELVVSAVDAAGNTEAPDDSARFAWRVDTGPPKLSFASLPVAPARPKGISSRDTWSARVVSDEPASDYRCRLSTTQGNWAQNCCAEVLSGDANHPCIGSCQNGQLFRERCPTSWSSNHTARVLARARYAKCVEAQLQKDFLALALPGAVGTWVQCDSEILVEELAHGQLHRLEVVARDALGNDVALNENGQPDGTGVLVWEWATDLMHEPPVQLEALAAKLQADVAAAAAAAAASLSSSSSSSSYGGNAYVTAATAGICPAPSVVLLATLILSWSLTTLTLAIAFLLQWREDRSHTRRMAGSKILSKTTAGLEKALEMIHMEDMTTNLGHKVNAKESRDMQESATEAAWPGGASSYGGGNRGGEPDDGGYV